MTLKKQFVNKLITVPINFIIMFCCVVFILSFLIKFSLFSVATQNPKEFLTQYFCTLKREKEYDTDGLSEVTGIMW